MNDWFMAFDDDDQDSAAGRPLFNPPHDQLPGVVPVELVIGRSSEVAVLLTGVRAFRSGMAMVLGVRLRQRVPEIDVQAWEDVFDQRRNDQPEDPSWQQGRLRWGFVFADGVVADNLEGGASGINLYGGGGSGQEQSCDRDYWLSSLPAAGSVEVLCEWPRAGLPRTTRTLDTGPILEAAARSQPLWPRTTG